MRIEIKEKTIVKKLICEILNFDINNSINGISIDSRNIKKNDLFIAMKGNRSHGSEFVNNDVLDKVSLIISDKFIDSPKAVKVLDSSQFLKNIAIDFRKKLKMKVLGITGTNGKTSTKELIVRFLKTKYKVNYSKGNHNSMTSLPLSILGFDCESDYGILEMGASKYGEIEKLCKIAKPDIGLITNISKSHLDGYQDFNSLVTTKMALYESVKKNRGTFFLNLDDTNIRINDKYHDLITYSYSDNKSDYFADLAKIQDGSLAINDVIFNVKFKSYTFAYNFLASYSIASSLGVENSNIINSLYSFSILKGRGDTIKKGDITIIDDTYNANLASMKCGIENLEFKKNKGQNIVLIIGDMLDLGEDSKDLHSELGEYISGLNFIDSVYCVGKESRFVIENINNKKINLKLFIDINSIITFLNNYDNSNTIFYIKGSRGMYMEKIIEKVFN